MKHDFGILLKSVHLVQQLTKDWMGGGGQISSPSSGRILRFMSRPFLGPTQPPIQWVLGAHSPGSKMVGAWSWPLNVQPLLRSRIVELYVRFSLYLHGVVLSYLSAWMTLPLLKCINLEHFFIKSNSSNGHCTWRLRYVTAQIWSTMDTCLAEICWRRKYMEQRLLR
jgi:hypothetical protein